MNTATIEIESSIIQRLVDPGNPSLAPDAAEAILKLEFPEDDRRRMQLLAAKAREGTLTNEEQVEIDSYQRVGSLLALLRSKARISLKHSASDGNSSAPS